MESTITARLFVRFEQVAFLMQIGPRIVLSLLYGEAATDEPDASPPLPPIKKRDQPIACVCVLKQQNRC